MKKIKYLIPYLTIFLFTPFYYLLDNYIFIKIFGCGCVPIYKSNMLNIPFNSNHIKLIAYFILSIGMLEIAIKISRNFENKFARIIYCTDAFVLNLILGFIIFKMTLWM